MTAQNHDFAVDPASLVNTPLVVTYTELNDGSVEGLSLPHQNVPSLVSVSPGMGLRVPLWACWELWGFLSNVLVGD